MAEESYEEACKCGKGPPEGPDESEEESMQRRFGPGYQQTGIGLIRSEVTVGNSRQLFEKDVTRNKKNEGPRGKPGDSGTKGQGASKPGPGKTLQKICMCGSFGSRGNRGSNGRKL